MYTQPESITAYEDEVAVSAVVLTLDDCVDSEVTPTTSARLGEMYAIQSFLLSVSRIA